MKETWKTKTTLPCKDCRALCCGPVPLTAWRLKRIKEAVAALPIAERQRLTAQKRAPLDCNLLDMKTRRCSVYEERPAVCRLFGYISAMPCPKAPTAADTANSAEASDMLVALEAMDETVLLSSDFDWNRITQRECL